MHLGAKPDAAKVYSENRDKEIWETFIRIIELCEREEIDFLLIAGDLFHRQPLLSELKEVNYYFEKLSKTQVILIAGNHDYLRSDSFYLSFSFASNVHTLFGNYPESIIFPEHETRIHGFSYEVREIREDRLKGLRAKKDVKYEILVAHGGDEMHVPFNKADLLKADFDYIALGHIHKPQELYSNKMIYAGTPEPCDTNDYGPHGVVMGSISEKGVKTKFIPMAKRSYFILSIKVWETATNGQLKDVIQEKIEEIGRENIYKIVVKGFRDPDIQFDFSGMDSYGNILEFRDETSPSYDYERLYMENKNNLLGAFLESFREENLDDMMQRTRAEGVQALLSTCKKVGV